jgi:hypothetical protein
MAFRSLSAAGITVCALTSISVSKPGPVTLFAQTSDPVKCEPALSKWVQARLPAIDKQLDSQIKDLVALYQHIHANPELSLQEFRTAERLAAEMRKLG